jgi:hypothetical protein
MEPFILREDDRNRAKVLYVAEGDMLIPSNVRPEWHIVNAPRPLQGAVCWEAKPLTGTYYAAGDVAEYARAWEMDNAYTVRLLTYTDCQALLAQRCATAGMTTEEYCTDMGMTPKELAKMFRLPYREG